MSSFRFWNIYVHTHTHTNKFILISSLNHKRKARTRVVLFTRAEDDKSDDTFEEGRESRDNGEEDADVVETLPGRTWRSADSVTDNLLGKWRWSCWS